MRSSISHVAITVPDLQQAEAYYQALFEMESVTRESLGPDGAAQLPRDKDWADALTAGVTIQMVALRVGDLVLALFDETSPMIRALAVPQHRPLFIGVEMPEAQIARVRERLRDEAWDDGNGGFRDRYGIGWQLSPDRTFVGAGDRGGNWLRME